MIINLMRVWASASDLYCRYLIKGRVDITFFNLARCGDCHLYSFKVCIRDY